MLVFALITNHVLAENHNVKFEPVKDEVITLRYGVTDDAQVTGQLTSFDYDFDTTLLLTIAEKINIRIVLSESPIPWQKNIEMLAVGDLDVAVKASKSEARMGFAHYSESYRQDDLGLIIRAEDKDQFNQKSLAELAKSDFNFGAYLGWIYGPLADGILSIATNVHRVSELHQQHVNNLMNQKIDGYFAFLPTDLTLALNKYPNKVTLHHSGIIATESLYFIFSKRSVSDVTVDKFNQALIEMKHSGELDKLKSKFGIANDQMLDQIQKHHSQSR